MVRIPIFQAAAHNVFAVLWATLLCCIDVVNIEGAEIIKSAAGTFPPKSFHEGKFALPLAALVGILAVLVVPCSLACERAETIGAGFAALFALSVIVPSFREIARLAAIFPGFLMQTIEVHTDRLAAMLTDDLHSLVSHGKNVADIMELCKPRYFDIACRRIRDAYAQPRLPLEERPTPTEQELPL